MSRSRRTSKGRTLFVEPPTPQNQPDHSPAHSSNVIIPDPRPIDIVRRDFLSIYLPPPPRQPIRAKPNNGALQIASPSHQNTIVPRSGPHLTPSAHKQTELLTITSQTDYDVVSDGHYNGQDYADSQVDQSFPNVSPNKAGSSNVQPEATITKGELIANYYKEIRKLNTKKGKFSSHDSW
ncbi:hypothetical protein M0R45_019118 [Rubus argutus]|uniref:Uncharacterized protein n=1 Tax=Rubus argutus TaxID=59490 RepID=A0AAW1X805_RUBAR